MIVFCTANTAAAAAGILFFCSYIPYFFLTFNYYQLTLAQKISASLSPNVALAFSCVLITLQEANGKQSVRAAKIVYNLLFSDRCCSRGGGVVLLGGCRHRE